MNKNEKRTLLIIILAVLLVTLAVFLDPLLVLFGMVVAALWLVGFWLFCQNLVEIYQGFTSSGSWFVCFLSVCLMMCAVLLVRLVF